MTMQLLVSVRNPEEALAAAAGGADFIDLKEPGAGALGGLPSPVIRAVVAALRGAGHAHEISATIGDWAMDDVPAILARVAEVAACGVDIVKVGVLPAPGAAAVIDALAGCGARIVPVFIADQPLDAALLARALAAPFFGVMADTADKRGGSLLQRRTAAELQAFVRQVRAAGQRVGLAGALRLDDLPALQRLAPSFAGFRSAVCAGDRAGALVPARLARLVSQVRALEAAAVAARPAEPEPLRV
jgi:uncharacterized protein (UPF0264 family)